jgi:glutaredoxin
MITIYSRPGCKWCETSKSLLELKGVEYNELMLDVDITVEQLKTLVPGAKSVPQIMSDDIYIGGYKELTRYLEKQ